MSETHTPTLVHFSRKQFGNTQKVIKTNSAKGSLAKVRINQRCPPICYSTSLQKFQEVHYDSRKKVVLKKKSQKSSLFINNIIFHLENSRELNEISTIKRVQQNRKTWHKNKFKMMNDPYGVYYSRSQIPIKMIKQI